MSFPFLSPLFFKNLNTAFLLIQIKTDKLSSPHGGVLKEKHKRIRNKKQRQTNFPLTVHSQCRIYYPKKTSSYKNFYIKHSEHSPKSAFNQQKAS